MSARRLITALVSLGVIAAPLAVISEPATAAAATIRAVQPQAKAKPKARPKATPKATPRAPGQPPRNYVVPSGARFAFPNRSRAEKMSIRDAVLATTQSTWGGHLDRYRLPLPSNGKIRMATWSFKDMGMAKALVAAKNRGVSVQVVAAYSRNKESKPWRYLQKHLGTAYYKAGVAGSSDRVNFARACPGACRGRGGTTHSKFFMFDNVGSGHARHVVMQSSMNLTSFGYDGQWNSAQTVRSAGVFDRYLRVYREMAIGRAVSSPYRVYPVGAFTNIFFPLPGANAANDPVMRLLNRVGCSSAGGRTRIRIINYAIYDTRGTWIAKKLRSLWNSGCDVRIIYALTSRPVLDILRNRSGRGSIPIRQSIILNNRREIVKYNHSKWMTVAGRVGSDNKAWVTLAGSSNWSNLGFSSDEQMQQINGYGTVRSYNLNFDKTWNQKTSGTPIFAPVAEMRGLPNEQLAFGRGQLKYLNPYGD